MRVFTFSIILILASIGIANAKDYNNNSVLNSGTWIKVSTNQQGVLKITYDQLTEWGITSPANVTVYTNGGYMLPKMNNVSYPDDLSQIPVLHTKDNNNSDAIFFYSSGTTKWSYNTSRKIFVHELNLYSDQTYFYITSDGTKSPSPEIKEAPKASSEITFTKYNDYRLYEYENINILKSGRRWLSEEIMNTSSRNYSLNFENNNTSETAILTVCGLAKSSETSHFNITANNQSAGKLSFAALNGYEARSSEIDLTVTSAKDHTIKLTYQTEANTGSSWLDYLVINQQNELTATGAQTIFRNADSRNYAVCEYEIATTSDKIVVWNTTDPLNIKKINTSDTGNRITFTDNGTSIQEYVAFNPTHADISTPEFVENVANQNIHGLPLYDFVIVTHPDFLSASETLAEYHRQADGMDVLIVTTEEVYNEFSSGLPDVAAIRNMARMFYKRKTTTDSLRYLLLMGDGSYNNRDFNGNYNNFIPTYQSIERYDENSYTSDDFFVLLDDNEGEANGYIDIGIGRIPCTTLDEAEIIVNKTVNYFNEENIGDWRNVITFLADDEDTNTHMSYTERVIEIVEDQYPGFYYDKIYFDAYMQVSASSGDKYPDATAAINRRVDEGTLILNYMGHANEQSMADEDVLTLDDFKSWGNKNKLSVFVTATCEFSRYDNDKASAGETILLNQSGGGVSLFSTSRLVFSIHNLKLTQNFYRSAFMQDSDGNNYAMGDIIRRAKNITTSDGNNKRSFALLGDPALQLSFPKHNVTTKSINSVAIEDTFSVINYSNEFTDTIAHLKDSVHIGALEKVTVEGKVSNYNGDCVTSFNGTVLATVYDKAVTVQTLANDGGTPFSYQAQTNVIYKGTSTITNGEFQFEFVVPKDIAYNVGEGKIQYYITDGEEDGNGTFTGFTIGGTGENPIIDDTPPEVELYLNNEDFKSNDKVSSSALLMLNLFDESGINTVGTGIGHDLVAILDEDYSNPIVLNNYYASQLNSYQYGQVLYPLSNLSIGEHTLSVKVWDIQNNSTYKEISFIVEDGFEITLLKNYPNPVEFETKFEITHNLPGNSFEATVELFNLRGDKVYEINESTGSNDDVKTVISWDITDTNKPIGLEKILVYRVTMLNINGLKATGTGKLFLKNN